MKCRIRKLRYLTKISAALRPFVLQPWRLAQCLKYAGLTIIFLLSPLPASSDDVPATSPGKPPVKVSAKDPSVVPSQPPSKGTPSDKPDWIKMLDSSGWAHDWLDAAQISLAINSDPVLRTIVCRVPFLNFTLEAMVTATGLSRERLVLAINVLKELGLVTWEPNNGGHRLIKPASDEARDAMLSWSDYWCVGDDQCGVEK